eukprot:4563766-Alexandrium_andersonii.AAC.1
MRHPARGWQARSTMGGVRGNVSALDTGLGRWARLRRSCSSTARASILRVCLALAQAARAVAIVRPG